MKGAARSRVCGKAADDCIDITFVERDGKEWIYVDAAGKVYIYDALRSRRHSLRNTSAHKHLMEEWNPKSHHMPSPHKMSPFIRLPDHVGVTNLEQTSTVSPSISDPGTHNQPANYYVPLGVERSLA